MKLITTPTKPCKILKYIFRAFWVVVLVYILFMIGSLLMLPEGHCDDPENAYDFWCVD
ncbi:uncharacterized protein METZ01_LOCUS416327 [marine metagenome]|uniref:Uncharacterized protein n=1 Tax=marine metagenome TaxID=408172 RepID=A0A382WXN7_9ZZZZ